MRSWRRRPARTHRRGSRAPRRARDASGSPQRGGCRARSLARAPPSSRARPRWPASARRPPRRRSSPSAHRAVSRPRSCREMRPTRARRTRRRDGARSADGRRRSASCLQTGSRCAAPRRPGARAVVPRGGSCDRLRSSPPPSRSGLEPARRPRSAAAALPCARRRRRDCACRRPWRDRQGTTATASPLSSMHTPWAEAALAPKLAVVRTTAASSLLMSPLMAETAESWARDAGVRFVWAPAVREPTRAGYAGPCGWRSGATSASFPSTS